MRYNKEGEYRMDQRLFLHSNSIDYVHHTKELTILMVKISDRNI